MLPSYSSLTLPIITLIMALSSPRWYSPILSSIILPMIVPTMALSNPRSHPQWHDPTHSSVFLHFSGITQPKAVLPSPWRHYSIPKCVILLRLHLQWCYSTYSGVFPTLQQYYLAHSGLTQLTVALFAHGWIHYQLNARIPKATSIAYHQSWKHQGHAQSSLICLYINCMLKPYQSHAIDLRNHQSYA